MVAALLAVACAVPGSAAAAVPATPAPGARGAQVASAEFRINPSPAYTGQTVTLDGSISVGAARHYWEWQDVNGNWTGSASTAQPRTSWTRPGTYGVHHITHDAAGTRADAWSSVTVLAASAEFQVSPAPAYPGQSVTLDGSVSMGAVQHSWEWQDVNGNWTGTASTAQPQTSWSRPGTYGVHHITYDGADTRYDSWGSVTIHASSATFTVDPIPAGAGDTVTLDGTSSPGAVQHYWEWQDVNGNWMQSASTARVRTSWSRPGTYGVHHITYDAANTRSDAWKSVTVSAQSCGTPYSTVAAALYAQVLEAGAASDTIHARAAQMEGGTTVRQLVAALAHGAGYRARFITGRDSRLLLADLYRHLLAREPDDGAWGWTGVGETQGWGVVIDALLNSAEYDLKFGEHMVPGDPVVAWDCIRATGLRVAHNIGFRDAGQGGASVSYTTPAYVSMDQPRSLTFSYHSGLADPRSQVQLNVLHASADAPDRVMLEVRNAEGARETLADGRMDVAFRVGQGASRVSAEFREPRHPNRNVSYTAVVRRYWPDGRSQEDRVPFRAANLDARASEFGHGWVLEGLQRLYDQGDGVHITEGATGLWFWQKADAARADGTRHYSAPSGDFTTVVKDASGLYYRTYPDGRRVSFHADGRMRDMTDRFGNATQYRYDDAGRLYMVIDPVGKETTLGYTGGGALAWVQDPGGRRVTTETAGNVLWRFREPDNSLALDLSFVHTADGRLVLDSYWTPAGDRNTGPHTGFTFTYDAHGRLASMTAPQVGVTEPGVGTDVPVRPVVKSRSLQMAILGTGWLGNELPRVRPEKIRVEVTDARDNTTYMAVDPFGTPVRVEEPLGRVARGTTDRHGRMMRSVSPSGNTTIVEYVGVEARKTINEGTGAVVQMTYEPTYHQLNHAWGSTTEVWNYHGNAGQLDSSKVGGKTTRYTYASRGRLRSVTDPSGYTISSTYGDESNGNAWANLHFMEVQAVTRRQSRLYDGFGRLAKTFSSDGRDTVATEYDLLNRVRRTVDGAGNATVYGYTGGELTSVTDAKQQTYTFARNVLGWNTSERDPRGQYTYYRYDRAGNVTSTTSRRGRVVTAGYDALGRMEWRDAEGQTTRWSYGPGESWTEVSNPRSTDRMEFDVSGRPTRTLAIRAGATYTLVHTLNGEGNRTRLDVFGPSWGGAKTLGFTYNSRRQLDSLTDYSGRVTRLSYHDNGDLSGIAHPNTITLSHTSDAGGLLSIQWYQGRAELDRWFDYDGASRADRKSWWGGTYNHFRKYLYERQGWLRQFRDYQDDGYNSPLGNSANYTYDAAGNRTDRNAVVGTGNRITFADGYTLEYDLDGNVTRKYKPGYEQRMSWNALGQMETLNVNGSVVFFYYDVTCPPEVDPAILRLSGIYPEEERCGRAGFRKSRSSQCSRRARPGPRWRTSAAGTGSVATPTMHGRRSTAGWASRKRAV